MSSILNPTEIITVAKWMLDAVEDEGVLYQEDASRRIVEMFGDQYCYYTNSGHLTIKNSVLSRFKRKSKGMVTWFPNTKSWRKLV